MKVLFAAGGTGGHINPALAAAGMVRERHPEAQILFVGTAEKMEARLVPAAGYDFKTIDISGFQRRLTLENIKRNFGTLPKLPQILRRRPKKFCSIFSRMWWWALAVMSAGRCCAWRQSSAFQPRFMSKTLFQGKTNKVLAGKVDQVMLAVPATEQYLNAKNPCTVTGLPVRGELLRADRTLSRFELGLDDRPLVLSMGGSLGAEAINRASGRGNRRATPAGGLLFYACHGAVRFVGAGCA